MSQAVTLREVREGAGKSLEECLKMEFCMVHHCCTGKTDFVEGVKALLIEKRGQAKWNPASIEQAPSESFTRAALDSARIGYAITFAPSPLCILSTFQW